ncbi:MAG: type II/IV secretion system ATPase subunit [Staphylothermus sp.]|nr:type II/IV secretion system ATPase subunit [Staphylothermus sp.]
MVAEIRKVPYLAEYVNRIVPQVGVPDYYTRGLPSELKKASRVNVIYPVGNGIYVHIYMPPEGTESGYKKYIVIEPPRPSAVLFDLIEEKMAELITEKDIIKSPEEKEQMLIRFLDAIVSIVGSPVDYNSLTRKKRNNFKKIPVYKMDYERLKYYLIRDKVGLGILEPFIKDPYIEDISCDGVGYVFIVHKIFGSLETSIKFETEEELDRFVIELSERIGKPVSHARPIVDSTLPDGSRINIVFGKDVSLHGSNFTIRKFSKKPISIIQLIKWGTLDERIAAYLWILLLEGMSGWISGETASGKTTTLNAIITFIRPTAKIITIQDTAEVQVPHKNWVRELTRDTGSVESSITMFDLLKAALRQRPNYIVVGEIRGAEGNVAFQAMQTGHPVLSTFHAGSVERLIQRVTSPPINVPKTQLDNLNFIIIQSAVYREGIMLRRMLSVNEILGYDAEADSIIYIPVFTWDPATDRFYFRGKGASYLLEEKIATMRGIPRRELKLIYEELELRAQILREMVNRNIVDYYDVFKIIARIYNITEETSKGKSKEETQLAILEGLRYSLKLLRKGELR